VHSREEKWNGRNWSGTLNNLLSGRNVSTINQCALVGCPPIVATKEVSSSCCIIYTAWMNTKFTNWLKYIEHQRGMGLELNLNTYSNLFHVILIFKKNFNFNLCELAFCRKFIISIVTFIFVCIFDICKTYMYLLIYFSIKIITQCPRPTI